MWFEASKVRNGAMFRHTTDLRIRIAQRGIRLLVTRLASAAGIAGGSLRPFAMERRGDVPEV